MLAVALAQPGQELGDVLRADVADVGPPAGFERGGVPGEVTPVRLQRVRRAASLHGQVVEVPRDRAGGCGQLSTSARVVTGRPCASATGPQVTWPSWVLRPSANDASRRSASRQPRFAISVAYGSVTFVSA